MHHLPNSVMHSDIRTLREVTQLISKRQRGYRAMRLCCSPAVTFAVHDSAGGQYPSDYIRRALCVYRNA